jgi:peptidyl-prolyl cis-trans isomerase C
MIQALNTGIIQAMRRFLFYFKDWRQPGFWGMILVIFLLVSCNRSTQPAPSATTLETGAVTTPVATELPAAIAEQPTATEQPLAARVNGEAITLAEYLAEQALYQSASGAELTLEDGQRVLADLIDQAVLAQAAKEKGFVVDGASLEARIQRLSAQLGSEQALKDWMATYGYTPESFRLALSRAIGAAWMRDQIAAGVPKTAEQVHVRQILLYNLDEANQVLAQLQAGNDFGNLAAKYDPVTKGDLGWIPRGYLPDKKLEDIAFNLQENQHSEMVETLAGYHIIQLIARDPQHVLSPEALLVLQNQAVGKWLAERRSQSDIQILTP